MGGSSKRTFCGLLLRSLFPRTLFIGHGSYCIYQVVAESDGDKLYMLLIIGLVLIFFEGIFNVVYRHGKELHWWCPSALLYIFVLIPTLSYLRVVQIECIGNKRTLKDSSTEECSKLTTSLIEQTGILVLIFGRWLLPQGTISRDQFSQIILIYIGTAADIIEFSELYSNDYKLVDASEVQRILYGVVGVWCWAVLQFAMTIALPEEGLKEKEDDDEECEKPEDESYFRSRMDNKVAPMTYMHYKSMLRQGFDNESMSDHAGQNGRVDKATKMSVSIDEAAKTLSTLRDRSDTGANEKRRKKNSREHSTSIASPPPRRLPKLDAVPRRDGRYKAHEYENKGYDRQTSLEKNVSGNTTVGRQKRTKSPPVTPASMSPGSGQLSIGTRSGNRKPKKSAWKFWETGDGSSSMSLEGSLQSHQQLSAQRSSDATREDNSIGIDKRDVKSCMVNHLQFFTIVLPVMMQDAPFFVFRFLLMVKYSILDNMMIILSVKNLLVIVVNVYRLLILYCNKPDMDEEDEETPSNRVRAALAMSKKISTDNSGKKRRTSLAIKAITRMRSDYQRQKTVVRLENENEVAEGSDHVADARNRKETVVHIDNSV